MHPQKVINLKKCELENQKMMKDVEKQKSVVCFFFETVGFEH